MSLWKNWYFFLSLILRNSCVIESGSLKEFNLTCLLAKIALWLENSLYFFFQKSRACTQKLRNICTQSYWSSPLWIVNTECQNCKILQRIQLLYWISDFRLLSHAKASFIFHPCLRVRIFTIFICQATKLKNTSSKSLI